MKLIELRDISSTELLQSFEADASKESIAQNFTKMGLPSKKTEEYRYAGVKEIFEKDFTLNQTKIQDIEVSQNLVIVDGIVKSVPKEVELSYVDSIDIDENHFDAMYYLGHIAAKQIISIDIQSAMTVNIVHRFTKSNTLIAYRVALNIAPNTHATVSETFEADGVQESLIMHGCDIFVQRDATLTFVKNQTTEKGNYRSFASHCLNLDTNAIVKLYTFDFGSASGIQTVQANLGNHAHIEASHLLYITEEAKRGTVTKFIHKGEHASSNQNAKNIITDKATGIFDALIYVAHSGKYTKAHQNSKAILLRNGAYMASKPQLEIYIDELEASHGSTTGQLDEDQLFYLRSRGIQEKKARKILVVAFANELIDALEDESMREALHESFEQAFFNRDKRRALK